MKRIIVADDEPLVVRVLTSALKREGYEVQACANGLLALEAIRAKVPDALMTDIEMPKMTGEELCKTLAETLPNRSFPIFVATSLVDIEHRQWSQKMQNVFFLEKPVSVRKLVTRLADYFNSVEPA